MALAFESDVLGVPLCPLWLNFYLSSPNVGSVFICVISGEVFCCGLLRRVSMVDFGCGFAALCVCNS